MLKLHQIYFRKFIVLFVLLFVVLGSIIYIWLKDIYIQQTNNSLLQNINIFSLQIDKTKNLDLLVKKIKNLNHIRVTIIDKEGKVLAESDKDKNSMDNHKYRPEIMEAKDNPFGQVIRHSKTVDKELLYVAKMFKFNKQNIYIRMAKEIGEINEKLISLALKVIIALIVFLAIAFYIAYKISVKLENETKRILKFLLDLTKKKKDSFIKSDFSQEFSQITSLLTKIARILIKQDRQKAKYTLKLKKANSQKDDIISAISHEFKNPISVINGYSQTLLDDKNINPNIQEKFLKKIHNNGEKLSLLIDKLRLSVRLDEKKLSPTFSSVNLTKLVTQNIEDFKQNFKHRNIIFQNTDEVTIQADHTLMEVAISNLIENGLKYSEDDLYIELTPRYISIQDSGIGINKKELEKITTKFYRVTNNTWNNSLGLGLSIVSNILKLHNFELKIKSEENSGSTFSIYFS